jgi:uncharacterized protein (TIGR00369 family)
MSSNDGANVFTPKNPNFEATVRETFARQGTMLGIGAEVVAVGPGVCRIRLPFSERVTQQHGYFHGGLIATIADTAGGCAAMTLCPPGVEVLTVEYKVNFIAPAKGDEIVALGYVVRAGRTLTVCRIDVDAVTAGSAPIACAVMQQTIFNLS